MTLLIAGARFCIRKRISPGQIHCAPHPHLRVWYSSVTQIWPAGLQLSCRVQAEKMGLTDGNWLNNSSRIDQPRPRSCHAAEAQATSQVIAWTGGWLVRIRSTCDYIRYKQSTISQASLSIQCETVQDNLGIEISRLSICVCKKLDDGWPESVEEQSLLLLLVWRHYITRQYIKDVLQADEKSSIKTILYGIVSFASYLSNSFSRTELFTDRRFCTQTLLHTDAFTHRRFYTQTLLHTDAFTHKSLHTNSFTHEHFYTETLLHTEAFTHRGFYTQTLFHTETFTHRRFYTQRVLHTDAFTHRPFYTQTLLHTEAFTHRRFYTQKFLHTDAFTHRRFYTQTLLHTNIHKHFYTQTLLHTETFTTRSFYTQTLLHTKVYTQTVLHTNTFTQRRFYTQKLLHTDAITHRRFYTQTLLHTDAFTHIAILLQFLAIQPHFVRKGRAKGSRGTS